MNKTIKLINFTVKIKKARNVQQPQFWMRNTKLVNTLIKMIYHWIKKEIWQII